MTKNKDNISPEIREIENEVDNFYKSNPLLNLPFGVAAWYLLAYYDDLNLIELMKTKNDYDISIMADSLVVFLRYPLYWLWENCVPNGEPPLKYDEHYYNACDEISKLAEEYEAFVSAFTYASQGLEELELVGNQIRPKNTWDSKYEAYDRLINSSSMHYEVKEDTTTISINQVISSVKVSNEKFTYKFGKRAVQEAINYLSAHFNKSFKLPNDWSFNQYTLGDFRKIAKTLTAICFIHRIARYTAAQNGCIGLGYSNSILIYTREKLEWIIVRYAGVTPKVASAFINDMTYGDRAINIPDPAIQPLIKLNENAIAIAPFLLLSSSMERNFTILLNKIPEERSRYSKLVDEKENHMRENIKKEIKSPKVRFFNGNLPDKSLPDIDLAIIDDTEKVAMIFELKWCIEPSEQRETIEKSMEISKGISQLLKLVEVKNVSPNILYKVLNIDNSYRVVFTVISENIIGLASIQIPEIPVINMNHLIKKYKQSKSLSEVSNWLIAREYLPIENKHFISVEILAKVGNWEVKWWGHRPIINTEYM